MRRRKRRLHELLTSLTIQDTNPILLGKVAHRIYPVVDTIAEQVIAQKNVSEQWVTQL
jgi:hypothetical protein